MREWLGKKEGKVCPICRVAITRDQLQRFAVGDPKPAPQKDPAQSAEQQAVPRSHRHIEYNLIDQEAFENIQTMETHGSYGSKIQTLIQHLLYIELMEPGAKSIVFSAWADSLHSTWLGYQVLCTISDRMLNSLVGCVGGKRYASLL